MNLCRKCGNTFEPIKGLINYCSLECRNSRTWSESDKLKKSVIAKNSEKVKIANKITSKNNIGKLRVHRVTNICPVCNTEIISLSTINTKYHRECYKTVSGGYRKNSGRGKCGWYKGYWCQSSYELAFVIYNLDNDIKFERNNDTFEYTFDGRIHLYLPDFKISDKYIEIKGYYNEQVFEKIAVLKDNLILLDKTNMGYIFSYVIDKYGKNFIKLFEGNPHNQFTSTCRECGNPCKRRNLYCSRVCSGKGVAKLNKNAMVD